MKKLTKTEAAKKLGVSRPTIYRLIRKGRLVPDENGLLALIDGGSVTDRNEKNQSLQDVTSVMQSSERLKDKYIAQLERENQRLREELAEVHRRLKRQQPKQIRQTWKDRIKNEKSAGADLSSPLPPADSPTATSRSVAIPFMHKAFLLTQVR